MGARGARLWCLASSSLTPALSQWAEPCPHLRQGHALVSRRRRCPRPARRRPRRAWSLLSACGPPPASWHAFCQPSSAAGEAERRALATVDTGSGARTAKGRLLNNSSFSALARTWQTGLQKGVPGRRRGRGGHGGPRPSAAVVVRGSGMWARVSPRGEGVVPATPCLWAGCPHPAKRHVARGARVPYSSAGAEGGCRSRLIGEMKGSVSRGGDAPPTGRELARRRRPSSHAAYSAWAAAVAGWLKGPQLQK